MSYNSIVDIDDRFALAFEMVGKVFTAFPIGRVSSAALATAHVHDAIGPSFYREIDKRRCVVTVAPCHFVPVRDDKRRSMIGYRTTCCSRAVVVDEDEQQNQEGVSELEFLILHTYYGYSCNYTYMTYAYVSIYVCMT